MAELIMWTIFDHPADYPNEFVVVENAVTARTEQRRRSVQTAPTLEAARRLVPPGLYCQPRSPEDESVIVETWF